MRKFTGLLMGLLLLLGVAVNVNAQLNLYVFEQAAGTYTEITGGTQHITGTFDDQLFATIPVGFTFTFNGSTYTAATISCNGYIIFGGTSSLGYNPISSTTVAGGCLAPLGRDLQSIAGAGSEVRSELSGSVGSQVFTVQWKNVKRYGTSYVGESLNIQLKIYEGSNKVEFIYGTCAGTTYASPTHPQVGMRGATNTDYANRTTTTDWAATSAGSANNATCTLNSTVFPASGLTFIYNPPNPNGPGIPHTPSPANNAVNVAISGDLTWTFGANTLTYDLWFGPTGAMVKVVDNQAAGATGLYSYTANYSTTYQWQVIARNNADLETAGPVWVFTTACATASMPIFEGFNSPTMPVCWSSVIVNPGTGTTPAITFETVGVHPTTAIPPEGTHMVRFNSYSCNNGSEMRLMSPIFSTVGVGSLAVGFKMFEDPGYPTYADEGVYIQWSIDNGATWTTGSFYPRVNTVLGWYDKIEPIPSGALNQPSVMIGFLFHSQYGNDIYTDAYNIFSPAYGNLEGYVYESGSTNPIENATVVAGTYSATTNAAGFYSITGMLTGTYDVTASATGYFAQTVNGVVIADGITTSQNFNLTWSEIAVNPLSVTVNLPPDAQTDFNVAITNNGTGQLNYASTLEFLTDAAGIDLTKLGNPVPREFSPANAEASPMVQQVSIVSDATGDVVLDLDVQATNMDNQCLGAEFDGQYIWVSGGGSAANPNKLYKHAIDGSLIATYDQVSTQAWGMRDLAFDGTYLYGGDETGMYQIDPATGANTLLFSNTFGTGCLRALTYYPPNNTFLAVNWSGSLVEFNVAGSQVGSYTAPAALTGIYGMAWDSWNGKLWLFDQSGTPGTTFFEYDMSTQALTGVSYQLPLLAGLTDQIAGGAFFSTSIVPGLAVLGGCVQGTANDHVFAMELNVTETWVAITGNGSGNVPPAGGSVNLILHFDATGYPLGTTKTANLKITSNAQNASLVTIPITMNVTSGMMVDVKVFLEGPYNATNDNMNLFLNTTAAIPLAQPYNPVLPYYGNNVPSWLYNGTEAVAAIPAGVVDWVIIELRDAVDAASATGATMIAKQACFIYADGSVKGIDGLVPTFSVTPSQGLFAVIWHRNHLAIMNASPLVEAGGMYSYDFSTAATQVYGGSVGYKQLDLSPVVWGMIAADGNADKNTNTQDKLNVWKVDSGSSGYKGGDFNLDSQVNTQDKLNVWKPNSGKSSQVPN